MVSENKQLYQEQTMQWAVPKLKRPLNYVEKKILKMTHRELMIFLFAKKQDRFTFQKMLEEKGYDGLSERRINRLIDIVQSDRISKLGDDEFVARFNQVMYHFQRLEFFEPRLNQLQALYLFYQTCLVENMNKYSMRISTKRENWTSEQIEEYLCEWYASMIAEPDEVMDYNILDREINQ